MIGQQVGNWIIEREIGRGGMGLVYCARHYMLGTPVAVKMLSSTLTGDQKFRDRFFQEARTQAQLRHPHIAQVFDFIEQAGQFYLVIEFLEGDSLESILRSTRQPLEQERVLAWAQQSLAALGFAHQRGIIHRDIKPSNIMLDDKQQAKVTDFGIALVAGEKRMTATGIAIGTPHYMSPEQIIRPKEVDYRSDIYSMGIVLYEMLTGRVPFDSDSDFEVRQAQVSMPPPLPRRLNPAIAEPLERILLKALAKDPNYRYANCAEFAAAITAYQNNEPITRAAADERRQEVEPPNWDIPTKIDSGETLTLPYRPPVPLPTPPPMPIGNQTTQWLIRIQLFIIGVTIPTAIIDPATTMITGVVLAILGPVIAWKARRRSVLEMVFGLSAPAFCIFCLLLYTVTSLGARSVREPIGAIALFYGAIALPLGIIALAKYRTPRR